MRAENICITVSNSSQACTWHNTPSLDVLPHIFTVSRNPDPLYPDVTYPDTDPDAEVAGTDTGRIWHLAQGVAASSDTTRTANIDDIDLEPEYPPLTAHPRYDLFWYGVAQGISNLSHISPYLTSWLNSVWTLT